MAILNEVINTLKNIIIPRYYRSERGFQTEFYRILSNSIESFKRKEYFSRAHNIRSRSSKTEFRTLWSYTTT